VLNPLRVKWALDGERRVIVIRVEIQLGSIFLVYSLC